MLHFHHGSNHQVVQDLSVAVHVVVRLQSMTRQCHLLKTCHPITSHIEQQGIHPPKVRKGESVCDAQRKSWKWGGMWVMLYASSISYKKVSDNALPDHYPIVSWHVSLSHKWVNALKRCWLRLVCLTIVPVCHFDQDQMSWAVYQYLSMLSGYCNCEQVCEWCR